MDDQLTRCLCCYSADLNGVLDLGFQPLANDYVAEPGASQRFHRLLLNRCESCSHMQLSVAVPPDEMFRDYLYVSGTTTTLREHFQDLAESVTEQYKYPGRMLDIGCNDGTLMRCFEECGWQIYGVDPAETLTDLRGELAERVLVGYWPDCASEVSRRWGAMDVICGANVLAHNPNPAQFLVAAKRLLTPDGTIVVEFPLADKLIAQKEWDTIYHEHVSYFSRASFSRLLDRCGLAAIHEADYPIHGGSLRSWLRPGEAVLRPPIRATDGLAAHVQSVRRQLHELSLPSHVVVGYGASAKSAVVLNYCERLQVTQFVDDNPLKRGWYSPGRHIPIGAPEQTAQAIDRPVAWLMFAWNFQAEIVAKLRLWRAGQDGDLLINYVPDVSVTSLWS